MLDLNAYISHYSGTTRLERLSRIAQSTRDAAIAAQAFGLLEQHCKRDGNLVKYQDMFATFQRDQASNHQSAGERLSFVLAGG